MKAFIAVLFLVLSLAWLYLAPTSSVGNPSMLIGLALLTVSAVFWFATATYVNNR